MYAFTLALILPVSAQAVSTASVINTNCSGSLTSSLIDGASFACAGNLTLDGGFITSDSLINITADGDFFVDNLTLSAPIVTFSNLTGLITIGSGVIVNTSTAILQDSSDSILTWSQFNIGQSATVSLNQGQSSKATLIGILGTNQIPSGVLNVNSDGNISLSDTNGVILQSSVTPLTPGGNLLIGSGSGGLVTTSNNTYTPPISLSAVPEPSIYLMVLLGLGLVTYRRKLKY